MVLYTIYEFGGEIFELNDVGDSGGNIGVSNDYKVFRLIYIINNLKFD